MFTQSAHKALEKTSSEEILAKHVFFLCLVRLNDAWNGVFPFYPYHPGNLMGKTGTGGLG